MKDKSKEELIKKINDLNKVIHELKRKENWYRKLIDSSPFAIIIHSYGKIVYVNKSALQLFNLKEENEMVGKDFFTLISADFKDSVAEKIGRIINKREENSPLEIEILVAKGETKWVEIFNSYVEFDGNPSIVSIILDITEKKMTEEKFTRLFTSVFDGAYESTPDGKLIIANPALVRMLGYDSEKELLSKSIEELFFNPEEEDDLIQEIEKHGELRNFELKLKRKDGSIIYVINNSMAKRDKGGKVISYGGTLTDITKRKLTEERLKMSYEKLKKIVESVIKAMVKIMEKKDPYTAGHEMHVAKLASAIGKELGFPDEKIEEIRMTALIHDIGKMFVPSEILVKPGKLTEEEFAFVKLHTYHGYEILKTIDFPWDVAPVVLQHHERLDGSGYPHRLKGDEILTDAKILSVADVVEAITFHRPYRPGHGLEKALQEISYFRGVLYDPDVVDACLKLFREKDFKLESTDN